PDSIRNNIFYNHNPLFNYAKITDSKKHLDRKRKRMACISTKIEVLPSIFIYGLYHLNTIIRNEIRVKFAVNLQQKTNYITYAECNSGLKVSIIDLGFNSAKLVNYHVNRKDNSFKAYEQEGAKVKLGQDLHHTGILGREPIQRTIHTLKLFRDIVNFQCVKYVLSIATSAVREANNKNDFLHEVLQSTGFRFRVLSGKEEALYSYLGALQSTCIPTALFFDLGGGSLELVYTENFKIKKLISLPLGALRLSQSYSDVGGRLTKKSYSRMEEHIIRNLPDRKDIDISPDTTFVGVGGTLRAMARYDQVKRKYPLVNI